MRTFYNAIFGGIFIALIPLCTAQADTSAPSPLDLVAPEILTVKGPDKVYAGSDVKIEVHASDNQGMKSVAIYYRRKGSEQYAKQEMRRDSAKDRYFIVLKNIPNPGVEYYLEATDAGGNRVRNGQAYSPLIINALADLDASIIQNMKPGRLSDQEILALFSNNTVDGEHVRQHFHFTRFYAADGRLFGRNDSQGKRVGRWRVTGNKLCERFGKQFETCREIVKEGNTIKKYAITRSGDRVVANVYKRFRYGNPENF